MGVYDPTDEFEQGTLQDFLADGNPAGIQQGAQNRTPDDRERDGVVGALNQARTERLNAMIDAQDDDPLTAEFEHAKAEALADAMDQVEGGDSLATVERAMRSTAKQAERDMENAEIDTSDRAQAKGRRVGAEMAARILEDHR